jgi:hypothetical protein
MLSSRTPKSGRVILTIDRETLSILEARVAPDVAGATNIERVWQAEVVEVLPRQQIPANTFELGTSETVISEVDPRQFGIYPISNLDPRVAVRYTPLAIPAKLPEPTVVSHLRGLNGFNSAVLQLYEAEWSTIAIVTPRMGLRSVPWERLDRQFAGGQFTLQVLEVPQATMASFVLDDAPNKVMQLYVWHALADEAKREEMVVEVLNSIELVDQDTIGSYMHRFPAQSATPPIGSLLQSPARSQPCAATCAQSWNSPTNPKPRPLVVADSCARLDTRKPASTANIARGKSPS